MDDDVQYRYVPLPPGLHAILASGPNATIIALNEGDGTAPDSPHVTVLLAALRDRHGARQA